MTFYREGRRIEWNVDSGKLLGLDEHDDRLVRSSDPLAPKDSKLETFDRSESKLGPMRVLGGPLIEVAYFSWAAWSFALFRKTLVSDDFC